MPPSPDTPAAIVDWQPVSRYLSGLNAKLNWQRIGFTVVVCALVSTQAFFQSTPPFLLEGLVRGWLDYFGECLLMGMSVMLAVTIAEVLVAGRPRWIASSTVCKTSCSRSRSTTNLAV